MKEDKEGSIISDKTETRPPFPSPPASLLVPFDFALQSMCVCACPPPFLPPVLALCSSKRSCQQFSRSGLQPHAPSPRPTARQQSERHGARPG
eukprot:2361595-Rhodomonas_salina.1